MPTAYFRNRGDVIDFVPTADMHGGDVGVFGTRIGVVQGLDIIRAGDLAAAAIVGVFELPAQAVDYAQFSPVMWDGTQIVPSDGTTIHGEYWGASERDGYVQVRLRG